MNIIDERDKRTIHRKLRKKEYDEKITLSVPDSGQKVRLLDEGMVVDAGGQPLFYLMKGTIKKYYEALPDDYEGSVNLGHMDFATFPFLLGKWTKEDMSVVDIGDGRMALDVELRLDDESFIVKELKRQEFDLAVSAEFAYHRNEKQTKKFGIEMIDEIFISDFAVVGEPGNVNSAGIRLKGGTALNLNELQAAIDSAGTEATLEELNKKLDALTGPEEEAEVIEETEEVTEEPKEEAEEATEEATEEVAEEVTEEVAEEEVKEEDTLSVMAGAIDGLQKELEALRKENAELQASLDAKLKAEQEFVAKFKNLSVSLSTQREEPVVEEEVYTDGIGE